MATLYGIAQSPWTHRARWALDHHDVPYRYHEHLPLLGELFLRRAARANKASVPLLANEDGPVMGSLAIARHAESVGRGSALLPLENVAEIERWNDVAERITCAGRIDTLRRFATSREAQRESLPPAFPGFVRALVAPSTALAVKFLMNKHVENGDLDVERTLRDAFAEVRKGLDGKSYLLGFFTYADVAIATALQTLRPHPSAVLGPGTAASWTHEALAKEYEDLLVYRDAIYDKHRPAARA